MSKPGFPVYSAAVSPTQAGELAMADLSGIGYEETHPGETDVEVTSASL